MHRDDAPARPDLARLWALPIREQGQLVRVLVPPVSAPTGCVLCDALEPAWCPCHGWLCDPCRSPLTHWRYVDALEEAPS